MRRMTRMYSYQTFSVSFREKFGFYQILQGFLRICQILFQFKFIDHLHSCRKVAMQNATFWHIFKCCACLADRHSSITSLFGFALSRVRLRSKGVFPHVFTTVVQIAPNVWDSLSTNNLTVYCLFIGDRQRISQFVIAVLNKEKCDIGYLPLGAVFPQRLLSKLRKFSCCGQHTDRWWF